MKNKKTSTPPLLAEMQVSQPTNYSVGNGNNAILIDVTVSTVGVADTVVCKNTISQATFIIGSTSADGNITAGNLGVASVFVNNTLVIRTIIDLSDVDSSALPQAQANVAMQIILSGGTPNNQTFTATPAQISVSSDGLTVIIRVQIPLI